MTERARVPYIVGVGLKMYFSHARTLQWCRAVAQLARERRGAPDGGVELFVFPSYLSIAAAVEIMGDDVAVGAQDLSTQDVGAFTGEVSGAQISELGCTFVEVGHAERRRLFGDTDDVVRAKTTAAWRNRLTPVLCVGESLHGDPADAAAECIRQFDDAVADARRAGMLGRIIVAYEPVWAIGAAQPALADHVSAVCRPLRDHVREFDAAQGTVGSAPSAVIYGGSAGPGLLAGVADAIDGVFLGRFAHDAAAVAQVMDEARLLTSHAGH